MFRNVGLSIFYMKKLTSINEEIKARGIGPSGGILS